MDRRTALIVIDMEKGFLSPASPLCIDGAAATVPACAAVIEACRARGVPVFFVIRAYRADGSDIESTRSPGCPEEIGTAMPEEFGFCEKDVLLYKPRFSALFRTPLDGMLRRLGVDTLLLAGTTTPNCIRTTAYDALSLEYNVAVLSDCTSSVSEAVQQANLADMARVGVQILSSADYLRGRVPLADPVGEARRLVRAGL